MKKLLYVEDAELQQWLFRSMFKDKYDITVVSNVKDAITALNSGKYDSIVTDLSLGPGESGEDLIAYAKKNYPAIPITVLTANAYYKKNNIRIVYKPFEKAALEF